VGRPRQDLFSVLAATGRAPQLPVRAPAGAAAAPAVGRHVRRHPGATAGTATVTLRTAFDTTAADEVTGMIELAFGQSLDSLRRSVEGKVAWDA
jgi:hypothetical protein